MIILKRTTATNRRIGSGSLKEGMQEAKDKGFTRQEMEVAVREHTDGAKPNEMRQVYSEFFKTPK